MAAAIYQCRYTEKKLCGHKDVTESNAKKGGSKLDSVELFWLRSDSPYFPVLYPENPVDLVQIPSDIYYNLKKNSIK